MLSIYSTYVCICVYIPIRIEEVHFLFDLLGLSEINDRVNFNNLKGLVQTLLKRAIFKNTESTNDVMLKLN